MSAGARTPEELETLLEDTLLLRDHQALAELFEFDAVLHVGDERSARGGEAIARLALVTWEGDHSYVADPQLVMQARDIALIISRWGINVVHRSSGGTWRYAIVRQSVADGLLDRLMIGIKKESEMTQIKVQSQTLKPMAVAKDEGQARWWLGGLAVIKATAADTGGQMSIIEITELPGAEAPLHVHHHEDEGFWLLEGDVTFFVGDATIEAHAGDYVFGPRGIPHRFTVGSAGCRMLFIMTPGGFEEMVIAMSEPAGSRTLPPPSNEEPDWEQVAAIAKAHGIELLG